MPSSVENLLTQPIGNLTSMLQLQHKDVVTATLFESPTKLIFAQDKRRPRLTSIPQTSKLKACKQRAQSHIARRI